MKKEKIILGIDPGTTVMGYGLVQSKGNALHLLGLGVLDLRKTRDHYVKIRLIFETTRELIETYHPDEMAIESPFYGKNVQSMLKLGRAQGVAMAAALTRDLPVFEYAPRKIKMSITGQGNASKEQVAAMLKAILCSDQVTGELDATDALAAAICHFYQKGEATTKASGSWARFLKENPGRIVR